MSRATRLLQELRAYEPADELEAGHRHAMLALASEAGEPFSRAHFAPGHFTASCYIIDDDGRVLLHHHRRLDRWLQMGGHVEADETPDAAALREGEEESGLADLELLDPIARRRPPDGAAGQPGNRATILDLDVHAIPEGRGEPAHAHFDVRYLARTTRPEEIAIDRCESNDLAWVTLDRAAALMPHAESLRVFRKIERVLRERSVV